MGTVNINLNNIVKEVPVIPTEQPKGWEIKMTRPNTY